MMFPLKRTYNDAYGRHALVYPEDASGLSTDLSVGPAFGRIDVYRLLTERKAANERVGFHPTRLDASYPERKAANERVGFHPTRLDASYRPRHARGV